MSHFVSTPTDICSPYFGHLLSSINAIHCTKKLQLFILYFTLNIQHNIDLSFYLYSLKLICFIQCSNFNGHNNILYTLLDYFSEIFISFLWLHINLAIFLFKLYKISVLLLLVNFCPILYKNQVCCVFINQFMFNFSFPSLFYDVQKMVIHSK